MLNFIQVSFCFLLFLGLGYARPFDEYQLQWRRWFIAAGTHQTALGLRLGFTGLGFKGRVERIFFFASFKLPLFNEYEMVLIIG